MKQKSRHSEGVQTEFDDWGDQGLRERIQELEKKVEEKSIYFEVIEKVTEKHYKDIIADLENQIKSLLQKNGQGPYHNEPNKKIDDKLNKELFKKVLDRMKMQKSSQQNEPSIKESEKVRKRPFAIEKDGENGIFISAKEAEISDNNVKALLMQMGNNLNKIQHLRIDLSNCFNITDLSIKELAMQIKLNTLQRLELGFSFCFNITDHSVEELTMRISTKPNALQHLALDFAGCSKVTDRSVKELAIQIGTNLKTLQHLSLIFKYCHKITDESVKELVKRIGANLSTLQHLSLDFQETSISQSAERDIHSQLKRISSLNIS